MRKSFIFIPLILVVILTTTVQAQLFKVGLGGGYTVVTSSEATADQGFHYGGKIVANIPVLPIKFALNLYNNPLSKEVAGITYESSFFSTGLGGELTFLPGPIKPYGAAEILYTTFGEPKVGDVTFEKSEDKVGLGLGAGVYFTLLPIIDLDLSAHYNMNSLFSDGTLNTTHVRLNVLFNLF